MKFALLISIILSTSLLAGTIGVDDVNNEKMTNSAGCCSVLQTMGGVLATPIAGQETSKLDGVAKKGAITLSAGSAPAAASGGSVYYSEVAQNQTFLNTGMYGISSPSSGTWTVPAGITSLEVVVIGGGGNGGAGSFGNSTTGVCSAGAGGSGYVKFQKYNVSAGQNISWSSGGQGQQSCFNGVCAAGGQNGTSVQSLAGYYVGVGGKGGTPGASSICRQGTILQTASDATAGGGGGFGGVGGAQSSAYAKGVSNGRNFSWPKVLMSPGVYSDISYILGDNRLGQGEYVTNVTAPLSGKSLLNGVSTTFPFTSGGLNQVCGSVSGGTVCIAPTVSGGTGYGGGGGVQLAYGLGAVSGVGGSGAIFVWAK